MLVAQITDSHIVPKGVHWKDAPETEIASRLKLAIRHLNEMNPRPDAVFFTGDVADEGDPESYGYFRELVQPLQIPLFAIPGNHDSREEMRRAFADHPYMPRRGFLNYAIEEFPVRLIGLDTLEEGEDFGRVCEERTAWLKETLRQAPDKPSMIFMHHPPVKVGVKTFDAKFLCYVTPGFEEIVRQSGSLLGIAAGHYHHLCFSSLGGKPCIVAPSLAPTHYFVHPDDTDPAALELDEPSITLHHWLGGGDLATHIVRLKADYRRILWRS